MERRRKLTKTGDYGVLNELIFCPDCGAPLRINRDKNHQYYVCSTYSVSSHKFNRTCTRHGIARGVLEEIVLNKIRETVTEARENKKTFSEFVRKASSKDSEKELKAKTTELTKSERRLAELYRIMKRLFEDSVSERISDEQYDMFRTDYEKE